MYRLSGALPRRGCRLQIHATAESPKNCSSPSDPRYSSITRGSTTDPSFIACLWHDRIRPRSELFRNRLTRLDLLQQIDRDADEIRIGDDAFELAVRDHGQAADAVLFEE